jgi:hypothetical protein
MGGHGQDAANAAFIVAAVNALPALLAVVKAAQEWRTMQELETGNDLSIDALIALADAAHTKLDKALEAL